MTRSDRRWRDRRSRAPVSPFGDLHPDIASLVTGDRRFFERFPHRSHRLRHMPPAEVQFYCDNVNQLPPLLSGMRWFVVVKQVGPGHRDRIPFMGPTSADADVAEAHAKNLYDRACNASGGSRSFGVVTVGGAE